jgi:hypothetical protein
VAPSTGELTRSVRAGIREGLESVPYCGRLNGIPDDDVCPIVSLCNAKYQCCGTFSNLPLLSDGAGVCQSSYLGGDRYALVLRIKFFSHLLQDFSAFFPVPRNEQCMDHVPFLRLVLYDMHISHVYSPHARDNDVAVQYSFLRYRILVRDCRECVLCFPPCLYYPNVGRGQLVEQRFVDG